MHHCVLHSGLRRKLETLIPQSREVTQPSQKNRFQGFCPTPYPLGGPEPPHASVLPPKKWGQEKYFAEILCPQLHVSSCSQGPQDSPPLAHGP